MSKEVGAGGRFYIFLDSGYVYTCTGPCLTRYKCATHFSYQNTYNHCQKELERSGK